MPGVAVPALAVLVIVRIDTGMVVVQPGSVPPDGQLLPGVGEVTELVRVSSPVSGLFTVTE